MFKAAPIRMWSKVTDAASMPWSEVEAALVACEHYWLGTTKPDGAPNVRPVWGVWLTDKLVLTVGSTTTHHNIDANAAVSVHLEDAFNVVIVEGTVKRVVDEAIAARLCEVYNPKYGWDFTPTTTGPMLVITPARILAWRAAAIAEAKTSEFPLAGAIFTPA